MLAIVIALTLVALAAIGAALLVGRELVEYLLEEKRYEAGQHRLDIAQARDEMRAMRAEGLAERHALLERIQRPEHEPYVPEPDEPEMKLNRTEDDEIAEGLRERQQLWDAELSAREELGLLG